MKQTRSKQLWLMLGCSNVYLYTGTDGCGLFIKS